MKKEFWVNIYRGFLSSFCYELPKLKFVRVNDSSFYINESLSYINSAFKKIRETDNNNERD